MSFNASHLKKLEDHATKCNNILLSLHEGCNPYYTKKEREKWGIEDDYGGITGTILPGHMMRFAEILLLGKVVDHSSQEVNTASTELAEDFRLTQGNSIFCDIGCGTGRPSFYFAGLDIKCSLGFDVSAIQILNSIAGHDRLLKSPASSIQFACPVSLFKLDAFNLNSLDPVTHAYAFIGKCQATILSNN